MNNISIVLNKEDLVNIWKLTSNYNDREPFKNLYTFLNNFAIQHTDQLYITKNYNWNPTNPGSNKKDLVNQFCEDFADKIKVSELFLLLVDNMPTDMKAKNYNVLFSSFNTKYPDFLNQLTQAMNEEKLIKFKEPPLINAWIQLVKNNNATYKNQEVFGFIKETLFDKETTTIKKIDLLNRFDIDKAEVIIKKFVQDSTDKPKLIEAAEKFFIQHNISYEKQIIPILEEREQHLFHYDLIFKPEGLMQKNKLTFKEAQNALTFTAYYLGEHVYYGGANSRKTTDTEVSLKISTPYEDLLISAKKKFKIAMSIIFDEFLTVENIEKINKDPYDAVLAKYLNNYIKAADIKNNISNQLPSKNDEPVKKLKI